MVSNQIINAGPFVFGGIFGGIALLALLSLPLPILIVSNRAEPDPRGMRPFSVYLFGMSFVTLLLSYAGLSLIVTSLLSFIGPHEAPIGNGVARQVVMGGLFLLIPGFIMRNHLQRGIASAKGDGRVDGPNARILHSYVGVVSFVFMITMMISLGFCVYMIFQLIGPGVFGGGPSRSATVNSLLDFFYVLVTSAAIVRHTWRHAPAGALRGGAET